jgi:hypothetical protein
MVLAGPPNGLEPHAGVGSGHVDPARDFRIAAAFE